MSAATSKTQKAFAWRNDLLASPRTLQGRLGYLIEDPASGKFHRLGPLEYETLRRLSADCPPNAAAEQAAEHLGRPTLPAEALLALLRWSVANQLVEVFETEATPSDTKPVPVRKNVALINSPPKAPFDPFAIRFSLGSPQRWLTPLLPLAGWIFSPHVVVIAALATGWLAMQLGLQWSEFTASYANFWLPQQQLWLVVCWLALKLVHEAAHGIACLRYGGYVRDCGLSIIFGAPMPFIDVTSSWRFESRWQRIMVAAAGMFAEWLIAIAAGFVWLSTSDPNVQRLCVYIITVAAAGTFLFNANPLVRFDGYYILCDLIDYPNLTPQAQKFWKQLWQRYGWGLPANEGRFSKAETIGLGVYGIFSWLWRWGSLVALAIAAIELYDGVGIALVALAAVLWFGRCARQAFSSLVNVFASGPQKLLRPLAVLAGAAALIAGALFVLPAPCGTHLWGVARYAGEVDIRTPVAGRVEQLLVKDGQEVAEGELLAILSNDDLLLETSELEAKVGRGEVRARQYQQQRELVKWQLELEQLTGLREQLAERQTEAAALKVVAPHAGTIFAPRFTELLGRHLKKGDALCALGSPAKKEVVVAIPQSRWLEFSAAPAAAVTISAPGHSPLHGSIERIDPRASTEPCDWSLATTNGGPLAVKQKKQADDKTQWQLLAPHFSATIAVDESKENLFAGQRCRVFPSDSSLSLGGWLAQKCEAWVESKRQR